MLKNPLPHYYNRENSKDSYSIERVKSRSKLDKRKYRLIGNNNLNTNEEDDFNTINSKSVRKILFNSQNHSIHNDDINHILNDKMPYIPEIERKKPERNFIRLINGLVNSRRNEDNKNINTNIFLKNQRNIPYKPKGYNYFEYIREHPKIINEDDGNLYSKIIDDLQKNSEVDNNNNYFPINLQKSLNKNNDLILSPIKKIKNKIKLDPILTKSQNLLNKLDINDYNNNNNLNLDSNNDISDSEINNERYESEKIINKTIDNNSISFMRKNNLTPIIKNITQINQDNDKLNNSNNNSLNIINNQKDYKQSDIFFLKNDKLSKQKTSEQYLFKKNYLPKIIENDEKTNLNRVGWSPKSIKNKSRIGASSVAFNILSPELKGVTPMRKEIDILNKNNFEKSPIMSEYMDLIKPGDLNLRQDFSDKLSENKNIFHKKNYCAAYGDLHHEYKDLVDNMF